LVLTASGLGPVVVILYMLKFSKSYPDRVTHSESPVTQARS
jgi:hypothetical protein